MEYYYHQKDARVTKEQQQREKAVQADIALKQVNYPYPTPEAYKRAVECVKLRLRVQGKRFARVLKGIIKQSNTKTKAALKELHVHYDTPQKSAPTPTVSETLKRHFQVLSRKKDKESLTMKRNLAQAFQNADQLGTVQFLHWGGRN